MSTNSKSEFVGGEAIVAKRKITSGIFAVQRKDKMWALMKSNEKLLCNRWFKSLGYSSGTRFPVQRQDGSWNFLNSNGKFLLKTWYKGWSVPDGDIKPVPTGNGWNFALPNGELLLQDSLWAEDMVYIDILLKIKGRFLSITLIE